MESLKTKEMVLKDGGSQVADSPKENGTLNTTGLLLVTIAIVTIMLSLVKPALRIREDETRKATIHVNSEANPALDDENRPIHHFVPNDPTMTRVR